MTRRAEVAHNWDRKIMNDSEFKTTKELLEFLKNDGFVIDNSKSMSSVPVQRKVADWKKKRFTR